VTEADVVLDTSAILTLIRDEPGSDLVEAKLDAASAGKIAVIASFVSLTELFYTATQLSSVQRAEELIAIVKSWPMQFIYPDEALCLLAGEIKASFTVSLADAFVAATAQQSAALLIHKDPDFEALGATVKLKALPYKAPR
jgi:predicted nucleic acid-binding protein